MEKNAKFAVVAVAVLVLSAFAMFSYYKVGADTESGANVSVASIDEKKGRSPLIVGDWNSVKVPWDIAALRLIKLEKDGETFSIEGARESGIIGSSAFLVDDGDRVLGLENEIPDGQTIKFFVNKTDANSLNIVFER